MMARASCSVLAGQRAGRHLGQLAVDLDRGGNSAVRNRSEPLRESIKRNKSLDEFRGPIAFHVPTYRSVRNGPQAVALPATPVEPARRATGVCP